MKRNAQILIAVVLASVLSMAGTVLIARSYLQASGENEAVCMILNDETAESMTAVEFVNETEAEGRK